MEITDDFRVELAHNPTWNKRLQYVKRGEIWQLT